MHVVLMLGTVTLPTALYTNSSNVDIAVCMILHTHIMPHTSNYGADDGA